MINFNAVDFIERRSEEVISFLWRSDFDWMILVWIRTSWKSYEFYYCSLVKWFHAGPSAPRGGGGGACLIGACTSSASIKTRKNCIIFTTRRVTRVKR